MPPSLKAKLVQIACDISNQLRDVEEIRVDEITKTDLNDFVMIDVRPDSERNVSIIPGAISVEEFEHDVDSFRDKELVAYCTAGYRSGVYAREKNSENLTIRNLRGGLLSWCDSQQPLVDPNEQQTHRVHVYGRMWNLVPEPYEGVW